MLNLSSPATVTDVPRTITFSPGVRAAAEQAGVSAPVVAPGQTGEHETVLKGGASKGRAFRPGRSRTTSGGEPTCFAPLTVTPPPLTLLVTSSDAARFEPPAVAATSEARPSAPAERHTRPRAAARTSATKSAARS